MSTEHGHSLWFVPPPGDIRTRLDQVIAELAQEYSSPAFVPHMTLAPDIPFAQIGTEKIADFARSLASQISEFPLTFKSIEGVPNSLYQCLYVKCELTPQLQQAVNLARTSLNRDLGNPPFKPHISICYKQDLPDSVKSQIIAKLSDSLIGLSYMVQDIQIWTNGEPINNWRQIGPPIPLIKH